MSYTSDIWLYPLQDWWRTVNEMSDFMSLGQMGNFIFRPVIALARTKPIGDLTSTPVHNTIMKVNSRSII